MKELLLILFCHISLQSYSQDQIDIKLNEINSYLKACNQEKLFLDKYNCQIRHEVFDIELKEITISYEFIELDSSDNVHFSVPFFSKRKIVHCKTCESSQQWSDSYLLGVHTKQQAFDLVNMLNELVYLLNEINLCK